MLICRKPVERLILKRINLFKKRFCFNAVGEKHIADVFVKMGCSGQGNAFSFARRFKLLIIIGESDDAILIGEA